jgi:hypothetical protein
MKEYVLEVKNYPKYLLKFKNLEGIFVGGCVLDIEFILFKDKSIAFAHSHVFDDGMGWICVPNKTTIRNRNIMLHEAAHIISKSGHTDKWRKVLLSIGGTLDPFKVGNRMSIDYHKKARK